MDYLTILNSLLIVGIIICIGYIQYEQPPVQEGLSLKSLDKGFKKLGKDVSKATKGLSNLLDILACPIKLFTNIHICALYFLEDTVALLIWLFFFLITFVIIYLPTAFFNDLYCRLGGQYYCKNRLTYKDVCPSKQFIAEFIELCFKFFGMKFLLRSKSDLEKCYCIPPIKWLFQPLTEMKLLKKLSSLYGNDDSTRFVVAISILCLIVFLNIFGRRKM